MLRTLVLLRRGAGVVRTIMSETHFDQKMAQELNQKRKQPQQPLSPGQQKPFALLSSLYENDHEFRGDSRRTDHVFELGLNPRPTPNPSYSIAQHIQSSNGTVYVSTALTPQHAAGFGGILSRFVYKVQAPIVVVVDGQHIALFAEDSDVIQNAQSEGEIAAIFGVPSKHIKSGSYVVGYDSCSIVIGSEQMNPRFFPRSSQIEVLSGSDKETDAITKKLRESKQLSEQNRYLYIGEAVVLNEGLNELSAKFAGQHLPIQSIRTVSRDIDGAVIVGKILASHRDYIHRNGGNSWTFFQYSSKNKSSVLDNMQQKKAVSSKEDPKNAQDSQLPKYKS